MGTLSEKRRLHFGCQRRTAWQAAAPQAKQGLSPSGLMLVPA